MPGASVLRALDLGRRTDGAVCATELRAAGVTLDVADREVRAGRWQRVARGVYVLHDRPLGPADLARAGHAYARAPCVVTGLVAVHLLGLRWLPVAERVHVLVDDLLRRPSSGLVDVRRAAVLSEVPSWSRSGVRVAAPERAVVDAALACRQLRDVRGVVLGAVEDRWASFADLAVMLAQRRRNGSALVRRALVDAERGCASPPEAELVDALVGCRRPFLVNPDVWRDGRYLGRPDVWLLGTDVGGEVDSVERHGSAEDTESTYDRHERFQTAGLQLVHLSVRRIRGDPGDAAAHLLARGVGRVAPSGLVVRPRGPVLC